jgi:hypothetical protein
VAAISVLRTTTNRRNSAGHAYDLVGNLTQEASTRTMTFDEKSNGDVQRQCGDDDLHIRRDGRRVNQVILETWLRCCRVEIEINESAGHGFGWHLKPAPVSPTAHLRPTEQQGFLVIV